LPAATKPSIRAWMVRCEHRLSHARRGTDGSHRPSRSLRWFASRTRRCCSPQGRSVCSTAQRIAGMLIAAPPDACTRCRAGDCKHCNLCNSERYTASHVILRIVCVSSLHRRKLRKAASWQGRRFSLVDHAVALGTSCVSGREVSPGRCLQRLDSPCQNVRDAALPASIRRGPPRVMFDGTDATPRRHRYPSPSACTPEGLARFWPTRPPRFAATTRPRACLPWSDRV
jgi:hypothetical protein